MTDIEQIAREIEDMDINVHEEDFYLFQRILADFFKELGEAAEDLTIYECVNMMSIGRAKSLHSELKKLRYNQN